MKWLTNSAWHKQTLPLSWLIDKFWPVPGWPENYQEVLGPEFRSLAKVAPTRQPKLAVQYETVKAQPSRVYVDSDIDSRGVQRVATALRKHLLAGAIVDSTREADLVVLHVIGRQDRMWAQAKKLLAEGKRYAVIQYCLRSTLRPSTEGWLPLWRDAEAVWSYLDLPTLCAEDGQQADFAFYHAPLGVDGSVFYPRPLQEERCNVVTSGLSYLTESVREVIKAARIARQEIIHLGPQVAPKLFCVENVEDATLAGIYSQSLYVSGLRRTEGFELPAAEGLLCGARPILFNRPHYRQWYDGLGVFIPEGSREEVIESLVKVFSRPYVPLNQVQIFEAGKRFAWPPILNDFWKVVNGDA